MMAVSSEELENHRVQRSLSRSTVEKVQTPLPPLPPGDGGPSTSQRCPPARDPCTPPQSTRLTLPPHAVAAFEQLEDALDEVTNPPQRDQVSFDQASDPPSPPPGRLNAVPVQALEEDEPLDLQMYPPIFRQERTLYEMRHEMKMKNGLTYIISLTQGTECNISYSADTSQEDLWNGFLAGSNPYGGSDDPEIPDRN